MPARDPAERSRIASIAALTRWSREDPAANAARGQAGLVAKFEAEVDPNHELPEAERHRRAWCAYRAHMKRISRLRTKAELAAEAVPL
jgi:hypothetical protein